MKSLVKKILISMILIVILFNFIIGTNISYGITAEELINSITNAVGGIVSIMYWPLRIKIVAYSFIIAEFIVTTIAAADGASTNFVTPFDIFFNKIELTSVDFFQAADSNKAIGLFRAEIAEWYYNIRLIALAVLAVIGVYVGIRMALSTLADEKAKYSKMLTDFVMSIGLLFVMQYIILFIVEINNAIVRVLEAAMLALDGSNIDITNVMWDLALNGMIGIGINSLTSSLVYAGIVILTFCFLIAYVNRMLKVGFLIIISPLITITYSIDKMKDNKSQALDTWLKEIAYTILIQPFHCVIYMSYITICLGLLKSGNAALGWGSILGGDYNKLVNGVLAIFCLLFIKQGEKLVRKIFGFKDDDEKTSFAAGVVKTATVMNTLPKAGAAARNIAGKAGQTFGNLKKIGAEGKAAFAASRLGKAINNNKTFNNVRSKLVDSAAFNKMKNDLSKVNAGLAKAGKDTKRMISKVKDFAGKPKKFIGDKIQKLDAIALNDKNGRLKRLAAAKTRNVISSLRKANSSSNAAAMIMGANLAIQGERTGNILSTVEATRKAGENFKEGSADQLIENLQSNANVRDAGIGMEDARDIVDQEENDWEENVADAEAKTQVIYDKMKQEKDPNKKKALKKQYAASLQRESDIRNGLASKRRGRYEDKDAWDAKIHKRKGSTKAMFEDVMKKGESGEYKRGSKQERESMGQARTIFDGVMKSEVENNSISEADAAKISKEFHMELSRIYSAIDQQAGLVDGFDSKRVQDMVNTSLAKILAKVPAFSEYASREAADIGKAIDGYRSFKTNARLYDDLAKYKAGGGTIETLVNRMYDREKIMNDPRNTD